MAIPVLNSASPEEQMKALLGHISAYIEHYHGGSVELVSFDGSVLKVRLGGACDGCPLSEVTLHGWLRELSVNFSRM